MKKNESNDQMEEKKEMKIEIEVSKETARTLENMARLQQCSIQEAAHTVLERYSKRAKHQIETAQRSADLMLRNSSE
ncbi:hypothetical protein ACE1TI_20730 [Alteribacillus sp. JSM 102045]|uniref:hypothetical protein n=1 Tax=Alteribacillus sp. JSM 102045 TaxID=1562101 RepID=UPI0035BFD42C